MTHDTSQPLFGFIAILKSAVIPALASAITWVQSTAARAVGSRATPARNRARYDRANWTNCATVRGCPAIQVLGRGNQSAVGPIGVGCDAMVIAVSMWAKAAVITA